VFSSSDCVVSNGRMISKELEGMWKEAVVISTKVLCQNVYGKQRYHKKISIQIVCIQAEIQIGHLPYRS
jgi:hypothetical protein